MKRDAIHHSYLLLSSKSLCVSYVMQIKLIISFLAGHECTFLDDDGCIHFFYIQKSIILVADGRGMQIAINVCSMS